MDLDFGHGFIPRIGEENYKAVDRCVGPTDLFSAALELRWAIVDGAGPSRSPNCWARSHLDATSPAFHGLVVVLGLLAIFNWRR